MSCDAPDGWVDVGGDYADDDEYTPCDPRTLSTGSYYLDKDYSSWFVSFDCTLTTIVVRVQSKETNQEE